MSEDEDAAGTSEEEIMVAIRDHYAPAVGTKDIADRVGVSRQATDRRLRQMLEKGYVESTKVGRSRIWWLTTEGSRRIDEEA